MNANEPLADIQDVAIEASQVGGMRIMLLPTKLEEVMVFLIVRHYASRATKTLRVMGDRF